MSSSSYRFLLDVQFFYSKDQIKEVQFFQKVWHGCSHSVSLFCRLRFWKAKCAVYGAFQCKKSHFQVSACFHGTVQFEKKFALGSGGTLRFLFTSYTGFAEWICIPAPGNSKAVYSYSFHSIKKVDGSLAMANEPTLHHSERERGPYKVLILYLTGSRPERSGGRLY